MAIWDPKTHSCPRHDDVTKRVPILQDLSDETDDVPIRRNLRTSETEREAQSGAEYCLKGSGVAWWRFQRPFGAFWSLSEAF